MKIKETLGKVWKKLATVVGIVIAVWLLSPIPEVSIIIGFFSGETLTFFIPRWAAYILGFAGAGVSYLIMRKLGLIEKIKGKFVDGKSL